MAKMELGKHINELPKATPNNNKFHEIDTSVDLVKPKSETIAELGLTQKHGLEFATTELHFADRNEAKVWIIQNQLGRRNLNKYVRSELVLQFKSIIAERSKERMLAGVKVEDPGLKSVQGSSEEISQSDKNRAEVQRKTASQLAAMADVSRDTIAKVEKIQQQASPEIKAALRTGDMSINAAYNKVQQAARKEDIQRQVDEIEQRAIEKPDGLFDVIVIDPPYSTDTNRKFGS